MNQNYKICPKCNNALDNNIIQCPYCGEKIGINFGQDSTQKYNTSIKTTLKEIKKLGCGGTLIIIYMLVVMGGIFISIIRKIISFFN